MNSDSLSCGLACRARQSDQTASSQPSDSAITALQTGHVRHAMGQPEHRRVGKRTYVEESLILGGLQWIQSTEADAPLVRLDPAEHIVLLRFGVHCRAQQPQPPLVSTHSQAKKPSRVKLREAHRDYRGRTLGGIDSLLVISSFSDSGRLFQKADSRTSGCHDLHIAPDATEPLSA